MPDVLFHAPTTVDDAVALAAGDDAVLVGGATSITPLLRERLLEPAALVWLGRVAGLRGIAAGDDGSLRVGAMSTLADLVASGAVRRRQPMVWAAAGEVGNPRVRAVATVGGAVVHADPRQDLLPALLAAGASLRVAGPAGSRSVALADGFYRGFLETGLRDGEVVTALWLPAPAAGTREAYERFTPGSREHYPTVAVAARVTATAVALGLGGVAPTPLLVTGTPADVLDRAVGAAAPIDDERGSARYKTAMVAVIAARVLARVLPEPPVTI